MTFRTHTVGEACCLSHQLQPFEAARKKYAKLQKLKEKQVMSPWRNKTKKPTNLSDQFIY